MVYGRAASAASFVTLAGMCALLWLAFFDDVIPLESERLVAVESVGIGPSAALITTREFCFSRPSEAEAIRIFRKAGEPAGAPEEVYETLPTRIHLEAGCYIRSRRIDLPDQMEVGRYSYQTGLRWCNSIGNCKTHWLPTLMITVDGDPGRHRIRAERPSF